MCLACRAGLRLSPEGTSVGELADGLDFLVRVGVRRKSRQERGGEGVAPVAQLLRSLPGFKRTNKDIADVASKAGEPSGQCLAGGDVHRALREEAAEQIFGAFEFVGGNGREFAARLKRREPEGFPLLAIDKPTELYVVGEQQIRQ